jgi:3-deoxy-D-manno-octulosonic-acid transferase
LWLWFGYGRGLSQRLGLGLSRTESDAAPLWIHAASVGEVRAARSLIAEVRNCRPQLPILLSTTTLTGRSVAQTDIAPNLATLLPIDPLRIVDRALRRLRPRCLVIVETEIWPGLFRAARRLEIPLIVASGRISPRSVAGYRRAAPLIRGALGCVTAFGMQTIGDAERIIALGAPAERVHVTGSLKALATADVDAATPPLAGLTARRLLVAASTHEGEEQFVLNASVPLWTRHPEALVLLAPRRPERFDEAVDCVRAMGVPFQRRTVVTNQIDPATRVLVLDTIGDLVHYFPFATAVFVGGTVAPLGGHNVLEPATYAKGVSFGPHTETVAEPAAALLAAGGAVRVQVPKDLTTHWTRCLDDPASARDMGARALAVASAGHAALDRTWALLEPYLGAA